MITIWIPMRFGRQVLFGCAVLATDASLPIRTERANLILDKPARERAVPPGSPEPDGA
jgi:hypothetical protein